MNCCPSPLLSGLPPPPSPLSCVNKYHSVYTYILCTGGMGGVLGLRQINPCRKVHFHVNFLADDILHCLLWDLSFLVPVRYNFFAISCKGYRSGCRCRSDRIRIHSNCTGRSYCIKIKNVGIGILQHKQCCRSGSGIQDPVPFWHLDPDPGLVKNQDPDPGWTTWSNFRRLRNHFCGLK